MKGLILFGHGARDIRWREPFDKLALLWEETQPEIPIEVSFLELMQPSLSEAVEKLQIKGIREIKIIPVFFGQGGHLRQDFPILLQDCQLKFPEMKLSAAPAVGENLEVLQAILAYARTELS
jgi:sirohydrochlorin cobaltochelatase